MANWGMDSYLWRDYPAECVCPLRAGDWLLPVSVSRPFSPPYITH